MPVLPPRLRRIRRSGGNAGFTLVEIAVVIVVLGILVLIAMPGLAGARDRARRGSCLSNQRNLATAATLYAHDRGIRDDVINCHDLLAAGYVPQGMTNCPDDTDPTDSDYDITISGGEVTDVTCLIKGDEHNWGN